MVATSFSSKRIVLSGMATSSSQPRSVMRASLSYTPSHIQSLGKTSCSLVKWASPWVPKGLSSKT